MSIGKNRVFCTWSATLEKLTRLPIARDGRPLSERDRLTWAEAVILTALVYLDLLVPMSIQQLQAWCYRVAQLDVLEVCQVWKDADSLLTQLWEKRDLSEYTLSWFKTQLYGKYGHAGVILTPLWPWIAAHLGWPDVGLYRKLHCALAFPGRVSLRDIEDAKSVDALIAHDQSLEVRDWDLANRMNEIMREWLNGFSVTDLPNHGPGAVFELRGTKSCFAKYENVGMDQRLAYVLTKHHAYSGSDIADALLPPGANLRGFVRRSQIRLVPKTALKKRLICKETATLQFYQQMVKNSLYRFLDERLRHRIDLTHAEKNCELAREGSISGYLATIDLSAASDSVAWDLVRRVFKGTTLLPWLYGTKSDETTYQTERGQVKSFRQRKFAPMGSALCFPVECLIFACVVEDVVRMVHRRSCYRVYGDDIIVESDLAPAVMDRLESLGFTVNRDKSFVLPLPAVFRESCGGEFVDGEDVTPVRISRRFIGGNLSPNRGDQVALAVQLANACYRRGLVNARRWIIHRLMRLPEGFRPCFGTQEFMLLGDPDRNYRTPIIWNQDLQRVESIVGVPAECMPLEDAFHRAGELANPRFEEVRYYDWFRSKGFPDRSTTFLAKKFFSECSSLKDFALEVRTNEVQDTAIAHHGEVWLSCQTVPLC